MEPIDFENLEMSSFEPDARKFWPREVEDFAPWAIEHLDDLSAKLGFTLTFVAREVRVGDFSVDIETRDEAGRKVLIELQFGPSDHRHLGQIVTYACTHKADAIVWLVAGHGWRAMAIRHEHAQTLRVLNKHFFGTVDFYAVEVELSSEPHLIKDEAGPILPKLHVVVRPET